jgi:hypothetical protein
MVTDSDKATDGGADLGVTLLAEGDLSERVVAGCEERKFPVLYI